MSTAHIQILDADWNVIDGGGTPADHRRVHATVVARFHDDEPCPFDCCAEED